jgi:hypothetical protein
MNRRNAATQLRAEKKTLDESHVLGTRSDLLRAVWHIELARITRQGGKIFSMNQHNTFTVAMS